jgi:hypothetical protein
MGGGKCSAWLMMGGSAKRLIRDVKLGLRNRFSGMKRGSDVYRFIEYE